MFSYWLIFELQMLLLYTHRCAYLDTTSELVWVHERIHALSSPGGGYRHATVHARVPPKPLPPPYLVQRLPEHQAAHRHVCVRGDSRCSLFQTHQVPLEEHHQGRVS